MATGTPCVDLICFIHLCFSFFGVGGFWWTRPDPSCVVAGFPPLVSLKPGHCHANSILDLHAWA